MFVAVDVLSRDLKNQSCNMFCVKPSKSNTGMAEPLGYCSLNPLQGIFQWTLKLCVFSKLMICLFISAMVSYINSAASGE